ncbi:YceK/YidQ family lipoprotein [Budviciaceae bacterium BWR-B9]|uniref:YceK/YidQ family lipoprotein n=1 Tax=Limnobaculum allomyrinae TaxID=2791986 RepID=A0ABS1IUB3_9GAMM|nr:MULTISPECIES: YceK/YidQ family lipoprotein [Limnobaculum]MBK5145341.1 YceK/YidQ family lipoprotein [Limnobaculum allomyrinae]MBV7693231.1 YceK/YidQ family lipoprotein [Limnobaculum sp. M2-1]
MRARLILIFIILISVQLSGCMSTVVRATKGPSAPFYPGTSVNVEWLFTSDEQQCANQSNQQLCIDLLHNFSRPVALLDLPFSLVLDTLLLPIDGVLYLTQEPPTVENGLNCQKIKQSNGEIIKTCR